MSRYLLSTVLIIAVCAGSAVADEVITLQLETPGFDSPAPEPEESKSADKVTTVTAKASQKPVGRVALITSDKASIHASRSDKSRVHAVCVKDTPLAIIADAGGWYGVLMIDGSTGWVRANKIKLLDYGVIPRSRKYSYRGKSADREVGNAVIQTALQYLGVPYVYGGNSVISGIDCSAFVKSVFADYGVKLPRTARAQADVGVPVPVDEMEPGDRLYFSCKYSYVDHCGIYMGNGYFIHASGARGRVTVDKLADRYSRWLVAAMR
ncbi:MAG: C40 family peptidase [Armatimonadetes bacterium]|nr:C40 family peptidase [Armatimonadota bacterium]